MKDTNGKTENNKDKKEDRQKKKRDEITKNSPFKITKSVGKR